MTTAQQQERDALSVLRLQGEMQESGRLLAAVGFAELRGIRPGVRVAYRTGGGHNDVVMLYPDGHAEGIRQRAEGPLWVPGREEDPGEHVWIKSGDPLDVVHELLRLDL